MLRDRIWIEVEPDQPGTDGVSLAHRQTIHATQHTHTPCLAFATRDLRAVLPACLDEARRVPDADTVASGVPAEIPRSRMV